MKKKRKKQVREEGKREKVQCDMHLEWPTPGSQLRKLSMTSD